MTTVNKGSYDERVERFRKANPEGVDAKTAAKQFGSVMWREGWHVEVTEEADAFVVTAVRA